MGMAVEETWLNPDYAVRQFVLAAGVLLGSLVILPIIFGALVYGFLGLIARLSEHRRAADADHGDYEEL